VSRRYSTRTSVIDSYRISRLLLVILSVRFRHGTEILVLFPGAAEARHTRRCIFVISDFRDRLSRSNSQRLLRALTLSRPLGGFYWAMSQFRLGRKPPLQAVLFELL
jgi:hypothetical protein